MCPFKVISCIYLDDATYYRIIAILLKEKCPQYTFLLSEMILSPRNKENDKPKRALIVFPHYESSALVL